MAQEHLEPELGAVLQFVNVPDSSGRFQGTEGYRWRLREKYPNPHRGNMTYYYLRRVDSDRYGLTIDQEIMDRCGRLLVRIEETTNG